MTTILEDYLSLAMACLQSSFDGAPFDQVPGHFQIRAGIQAQPDISQFEDECCEGLAYVRIRRIYPSANFPEPDETAFPPCAPYSIAVETEMAIYRCFPVGTAENVPGDNAQTAAGLQEAQDYSYLYKAMCCVKTAFEDLYRTESVAMGDWEPFEVQGGCFGSRIQFIAQLECPGSDC